MTSEVERQPEEQQPPDRDPGPDLLPAGQWRAEPVGQDGQDADPTGGDRLHQGQRRQAQGGDVEAPTDPSGAVAQHPLAVRDEEPGRGDGVPERQRAHGVGRSVLDEVPDVEGHRGQERQREAGGEGHRPALTPGAGR